MVTPGALLEVRLHEAGNLPLQGETPLIMLHNLACFIQPDRSLPPADTNIENIFAQPGPVAQRTKWWCSGTRQPQRWLGNANQ